MAMIKMTVIGNIGADAVQRETNGRRYTTFNVAVSSKYKNQEGMETERTTWISCSRDGQSQVDQWLKRGRQVYLEGTPSLSMYTDSQGHPSCNFKLAVHRVELLGGRDESQQQVADTTQQLRATEDGTDGMPFF